jgi:ABC-type transporter Mla MlaB component
VAVSTAVTGAGQSSAVAVLVRVREGNELARWPLRSLRRPDLSLVDDLARLQLDARRLGCSIRVEGACADLRSLLELVGLTAVIPCGRDGDPSASGGLG